MRLITHNMLQCNVKNCNTNNFPLRFEEAELERTEVDPNPEFIKNMMSRIDWPALAVTSHQLGIANLPEVLPSDALENEDILQTLHNLLLETQVKSGKMVCGGCGHIYPIKDGIANMLLAEHEL